jgi:N-acylglucosamine 2-epimerase
MTLQELKALLTTELKDHCIPFWLKYGADEINGGLYNCLDRTGNIYSTDKSVWMQGRCGWMYSYLYNNIEKEPKYLTLAKSCIDFAKKNAIDSDGRMFFTVTADGKPLRKRRYWFSETFYIIANAEYFLATGEEAYLAEAKKYYDFVYGMYCDPATDPYKITPKGYASTRDTKSLANPMIMLNVTAVMRQADPACAVRYNDIAQALVKDIKAFHSDEHGATFECISADGKFLLDSQTTRVINPGHDMECAWFLLEEAIRTDDNELVSFAEKMFNEAFQRGWDEQYGGIVYFKDVLGTPVEAYEHDMKLWWVHNEAVIASLMLYLRTGKEQYREILDQVVDYAFTHFSDREYGEWYGYLRRDGKPTEPPCKGHTYKGPFHVMRMLSKCILMLEEAGY